MPKTYPILLSRRDIDLLYSCVETEIQGFGLQTELSHSDQIEMEREIDCLQKLKQKLQVPRKAKAKSLPSPKIRQEI